MSNNAALVVMRVHIVARKSCGCVGSIFLPKAVKFTHNANAHPLDAADDD